MHQRRSVGAEFALGSVEPQHGLALTFRDRFPPLPAIDIFPGAGARDQEFFRCQRDAVGVGVIQQAAMVRLWNQSAGSAAGFFMLPTIRR